MSNTTVAKRYALALLQIAKEKQLLEPIMEDLRVVKEVTGYTPELKAVLHSFKLTKEAKKAVLTSAFSSVNQYVLNTLLVLVDRHREDNIEAVIDEFLQLANEEMGVAAADVYSTRQLSDAEREAISAIFAAKIGKKSLYIKNFVDSDLLGGLKLRIGNRIYDGSLRGKLDRLERTLI
ncbi:F0F1 ATP synthase subunit delta [Bacillus rubiinfantis]|uniref:F0F1 ATP synthase subunit delta n=1 Tax=Bacillus rubiinfantis TaxID=1499680 RepID=UPI0005AA0F71|nr:F0F1 ATP synthase subunit delta [Bacillus rubiinfantis]